VGSISPVHWLVVAVFLALVLFPIARILRRAGFSGWWALVWLIPLVNIAALWVFAYRPWRVEGAASAGN
jgi:hypothetical protein